MIKKIYFLDFENLQSTQNELNELIDETCEVYLFHGAHQNNFPTYWMKTAIDLGHRLHMIQLKESANNALDFFISYYIGKLASDNSLEFFIISNDKGYDPLIDHLATENISVTRISRTKATKPKKVPPVLPDDIDPKLIRLAKVALSRSNRPTNKTKLYNLIESSSVFGRFKDQPLPNIDMFVDYLQSLEILSIENQKVIHHLPVQSSTHTSPVIKNQISQVLSPKMIQQIQNIFSKANRPTKVKSLRSVIESSVISQKDNINQLKTDDVIQYLQLSKTINIHNGSVTYQTPISQPLLNQNYEKCQKILIKINPKSRPATQDKYIASIKSWVKCTDSEALEIFKKLQKNKQL